MANSKRRLETSYMGNVVLLCHKRQNKTLYLVVVLAEGSLSSCKASPFCCTSTEGQKRQTLGFLHTSWFFFSPSNFNNPKLAYWLEMSCRLLYFLAQSPVHQAQLWIHKFARHHSWFPSKVLIVLSLFPLREGGKRKTNLKAFVMYKNMFQKSKLYIKNDSYLVLDGYVWKELFVFLSVGPSIPHQDHFLSHLDEELLSFHHILSESSLIVPLHSITFRENTNQSR